MDPVRYAISEELHLAFWKLQFDSSIRRAVLILIGLVLALVVLALLLDDTVAAVSVGVGGAIGGLLVMLVSRFVIIPRQAAKAWGDYALIKEEMEITMREVGFTIKQPSAHVDAEWTKMIAWDETDALFAMYLNRQLAYILPKDQVSGAHIDFARDRLVATGLVKKGKRRK